MCSHVSCCIFWDTIETIFCKRDLRDYILQKRPIFCKRDLLMCLVVSSEIQSCALLHLHVFIYLIKDKIEVTGWRRLVGSPKLQMIFHKRATEYRSLLRKMTYKGKGSYESSPPCTEVVSSYISYRRYIDYKKTSCSCLLISLRRY